MSFHASLYGVFGAPKATVPELQGLMAEIENVREWAAELRAFTNRNAGRRTVLSEADSGEGARKEESDYPFRGVSWDPRDRRVQIMLGEQRSVDRHLTRSISGVRTIDLLRDDAGRDEGLRIAHEGGETRLRFVRFDRPRAGAGSG